MAIARPFHLQNWINEHRHELKPPVGNRQIYFDNDDFIVMVVAGPNGRKDYHFEEGEELFYQLEGSVFVKIFHENGEPETIEVRAGEMFLLPPRTPHSPQRGPGTVGLVIERHRQPGEIDKLLWFCENCHKPLHEAGFELKDIGSQIRSAIEAYREDLPARTCLHCGTIMEM